jgi:hypothetical protein
LVATLTSLDKTVGIFNRHLAIGGTVDHIHRGAHVAPVASQEITKKYYGANRG